ncbi:uncharacterized protein LOC141759001 [Sebastes fasciatus]|uniref:uncharacterized protein LOC141759001 n=1 Tax=Sebastes fasciatus TaxID=394691 RepID=UPI003D9EB7F5
MDLYLERRRQFDSQCHKSAPVITGEPPASASNLQLPPPPADCGRQLRPNLHLQPLPATCRYRLHLQILADSYGQTSTYSLCQLPAAAVSTCRFWQTAADRCAKSPTSTSSTMCNLCQASIYSLCQQPAGTASTCRLWQTATAKPPPTASASNLQVPLPPADSGRQLQTNAPKVQPPPHATSAKPPPTASASNLQLPPPPADCGRQLRPNLHLQPLPSYCSCRLHLQIVADSCGQTSTYSLCQQPEAAASTCRFWQTATAKPPSTASAIILHLQIVADSCGPISTYSLCQQPAGTASTCRFWQTTAAKPPPTASASFLQLPPPSADSGRQLRPNLHLQPLQILADSYGQTSTYSLCQQPAGIASTCRFWQTAAAKPPPTAINLHLRLYLEILQDNCSSTYSLCQQPAAAASTCRLWQTATAKPPPTASASNLKLLPPPADSGRQLPSKTSTYSLCRQPAGTASTYRFWQTAMGKPPPKASVGNLQLPPPPADSGRQLRPNLHLQPLPSSFSCRIHLQIVADSCSQTSTYSLCQQPADCGRHVQTNAQSPTSTSSTTCNLCQTSIYSLCQQPAGTASTCRFWQTATAKPPPTASASNLQVQPPPTDSGR